MCFCSFLSSATKFTWGFVYDYMLRCCIFFSHQAHVFTVLQSGSNFIATMVDLPPFGLWAFCCTTWSVGTSRSSRTKRSCEDRCCSGGESLQVRLSITQCHLQGVLWLYSRAIIKHPVLLQNVSSLSSGAWPFALQIGRLLRTSSTTLGCRARRPLRTALRSGCTASVMSFSPLLSQQSPCANDSV